MPADGTTPAPHTLDTWQSLHAIYGPDANIKAGNRAPSARILRSMATIIAQLRRDSARGFPHDN